MDTPCSHYVTGGVRYLAWPALGDCCSCCTDAQGCGIVKPNWISADNGTYVGQKKVDTQYYSDVVDEWLAFGVQVRTSSPGLWTAARACTPASPCSPAAAQLLLGRPRYGSCCRPPAGPERLPVLQPCDVLDGTHCPVRLRAPLAQVLDAVSQVVHLLQCLSVLIEGLKAREKAQRLPGMRFLFKNACLVAELGNTKNLNQPPVTRTKRPPKPVECFI